MDEQWATHIKTLVCVDRVYDVMNTKTKKYEQRNETAWYVSNGELTAQQGAGYVLHHWGIENTNHNVRDVSMAEDYARIRDNAANMAILRSTAVNTMRHQKLIISKANSTKIHLTGNNFILINISFRIEQP